MSLARYAKAAAGVLVTVGAFVASVLTDGISPQEWVLIAGTGASAVGVGIVPNLPAGVASYAKGFVSFFVAGTTALSVAILGGLTVAEAIEVGVVAFAAVGVTVLSPNASE
jgi:hypothetical protein